MIRKSVAIKILDEYQSYTNGDIKKVIIWEVPKSEDFPEGIKYHFALIHEGKRILGYDNERVKGHHKHILKKEIKIKFHNLENLYRKFTKEVNQLRKEYMEDKK